MAKEKKSFNIGVYAVFTGIIMAVVLVVLTIFAFTTRYTAFSPEKVAVAYTDCIVQTGDGYNAYKQTLVSKNQKYGEFVKNAYMTPYVNDGDDVKQNDLIGSGAKEEAELLDSIYNQMYDYFVELVKLYGFDNYDAIFTNYFAKLKEVRVEVLGDDYMSTDFMFSVFESNVASYGESLTGTQNVFASDDKTLLTEESTGIYQTMFGDEQDVEVDKLVDGKKESVTEKQLVYKLTAETTETKELTEDEVKEYVASYKERISTFAQSGEARADNFGLKDDAKETLVNAFKNLDCSDDITAVTLCTVEIKNQRNEVVAKQSVYVVAVGSSWYVDETNVDTSALYFAK